jgi:hypothetical protein
VGTCRPDVKGEIQVEETTRTLCANVDETLPPLEFRVYD